MPQVQFAKLEEPIKGLEHGRRVVQSLLGEASLEVVSDRSKITRIQREDFQSPTFRAAGYQHMPQRYGMFDGTLFILEIAGDKKAALIVSKASKGNPFAVGHAAGGGLDLRKSETIAYLDEGKGTLFEIGVQRKEYTGELGNLGAILPYARRTLGDQISTQVYDRG